MAAGAAFTATASGNATDPVIFDHSFTETGLVSSHDLRVSPFPSHAADDFVLGANNVVTGISWNGGWINTPPFGFTTAGFNIFFYADDGTGNAPVNDGVIGDFPGTPFASAFVPWGDITIIITGVDRESYSMDLPSAITIPSGTQVWMAIQSANVFLPQWGWASNNGGGNAVQGSILGAPYWTTLSPAVQMDFQLHGVPAPASLALLGLGGLVATRRRR